MASAAVRIKADISVFEKGKRSPQYTLDTDINGEVSLKDFLDFTKSTLIIIASETLKEEQNAGFDPDPITLVDGKKNRSLQLVHPLGRIDFVSHQAVSKVLLEAYNGLLERSKVLTGQYKASHVVFHNGEQIASSYSSLVVWLNGNPEIKDNDTIRIVNIVPYARRLELLGVTAQRSNPKREEKGRRKKQKTGVFFKVPNGAYQLTARALKSKFKQNVDIRFTFISGSSLGISGNFKTSKPGKTGSRPYLYPCLVFKLTKSGTINV